MKKEPVRTDWRGSRRKAPRDNQYIQTRCEAEDDPFASEKTIYSSYMTSGIFRTRNTINLFDVVHQSRYLTMYGANGSFLPVISSILLVLLSGVFYLYRMSWKKKVLWSFAVVIGGAGFQL